MTHHRVITIVLCCFALGGCRKLAVADPPVEEHVDGGLIIFGTESPKLAAVRTEEVASTLADSVRFGGRLGWDEEATVRVFSPFGGMAVRVLARPGQAVRAGDTIALIDAPDYGQAQADARRAATDKALAERTLTRTRDLFAHGIVAQKDVDVAEADAARSRAESERARTRLIRYVGDSTAVSQVFALRAPTTGVVMERNLTTGQEVRADQMLANAPQLFAPLFVISDPARLWFQLDVPERDLDNIRPGATVVLRTQGSPDRALRGRVTLIAGTMDSTTRTVRVRGEVTNADGALKPEMLVTVSMPRAGGHGLAVPTAAVLLDGDKHVVFVEEGRGRFRRVDVDAGSEHGGMIEIKSGLERGQHVVIGGGLLLEQMLHADPHS